MTDGGYGADYTFEATGNVKVMAQAVEAARMAWGLCTVAGVAGKGETLDVIPRWLITGRRVAGSSFGGVKGREGVPKLVDLYMQGEIDVDPFISHRITLDEVNKGFDLMEAQDGIRSVIEFDLDDSRLRPRTRRIRGPGRFERRRGSPNGWEGEADCAGLDGQPTAIAALRRGSPSPGAGGCGHADGTSSAPASPSEQTPWDHRGLPTATSGSRSSAEPRQGRPDHPGRDGDRVHRRADLDSSPSSITAGPGRQPLVRRAGRRRSPAIGRITPPG